MKNKVLILAQNSYRICVAKANKHMLLVNISDKKIQDMSDEALNLINYFFAESLDYPMPYMPNNDLIQLDIAATEIVKDISLMINGDFDDVVFYVKGNTKLRNEINDIVTKLGGKVMMNVE